eukprot:766880-Hanusia_phi.AAC.2
MSQFRSEEMQLLQLYIQSDAAHDTLYELGSLGAIQFKDVRMHSREFRRDVRKCEDMLRILRYLKGHFDKEKISTGDGSRHDVAPLTSLNELHERLQELEKEMKDHSDKYGQLVKQRTELEEHVQVLRHASKWFGQASRSGIAFTAPALDEDGRHEMSSLLDENEVRNGLSNITLLTPCRRESPEGLLLCWVTSQDASPPPTCEISRHEQDDHKGL